MDFWSQLPSQPWHLLTIEEFQPLTSVLLSNLNYRGKNKLSKTFSFLLRVLMEAIMSKLMWNWRHQFQLGCVKIVNTRPTVMTALYCLWTNSNFPSLRRWGIWTRPLQKRMQSFFLSPLLQFPSACSLPSVSPSFFPRLTEKGQLAVYKLNLSVSCSDNSKTVALGKLESSISLMGHLTGS